MSSTLIIGMGNRTRGDDQVGLRVLDLLRRDLGAQVEIIENHGDGLDLLENWCGKKNVYLIDAYTEESDTIGKIKRWEANKEKIPAQHFTSSTHVVSVTEVIELARAMNKLPENLIVFAISSGNFEHGSQLSRDLEQAAETVAQTIKYEIGENRHA